MANDTRDEAGVTLKFGTVSAVDTDGRCRVRLADFDNLRTASLPVLQPKTQDDKHYWLPDIGEQVAVLLDGRGDDGLVLGAIYSSEDTAPVANIDKHHVRYKDGAAFEYDRQSHTLTINGGIDHIVIEVGADVTVKAGTKVTIDVPDTEITGNLLVQGSITYMQGMAGYGSIQGASAGAVFNGSVEIKGNARIDNNIDVGGNATVAGTNPNHHSH
jgi:phage baseplate assembly protein V